MWEIYSSQTAGVMPRVIDLLFISDTGADVSAVESGGRNDTQTPAYFFPGTAGKTRLSASGNSPSSLVTWVLPHVFLQDCLSRPHANPVKLETNSL